MGLSVNAHAQSTITAAPQAQFVVASAGPVLTNELVFAYASTRAAEKSRKLDITFHPSEWGTPIAQPALTSDALSQYVKKRFVPTATKIQNAQRERLCLAQAIYHEARGETETGQLAVANIILNRVASKRYPATICGVVFQNAGGKKFHCQFTFACDGRSDMGGQGNRIVRESWVRANIMALAAFTQFQQGHRPDTLPGSALYYHTVNVSPEWSSSLRAVAAIGSHIFYAPS